MTPEAVCPTRHQYLYYFPGRPTNVWIRLVTAAKSVKHTKTKPDKTRESFSRVGFTCRDICETGLLSTSSGVKNDFARKNNNKRDFLFVRILRKV